MGLKIALLGCGRIAQKHAEVISALPRSDIMLSAVCDSNEERARALGDKYDVKSYQAISDLIDNEDVEVVAVLTESGNHAAHSIEVIGRGKNVLIEKPMALNLADADAIIAATKKTSVSAFVVKQNRFNLPIVKLKQAMDEGRFGILTLGTVRVRWCRDQQYYDQADWRGTWRFDGGVLANQAIHHIDLLIWLMGEPTTVYAKSSTRLISIEAEETAVVSLEFKNGALGTIEATNATRPENLEGSISILGSGGAVEVGGFAANEIRHWHFVDKKDDDEHVRKAHSTNPPNVYGFGHVEVYKHMIKSLRGEPSCIVTAEEAIASLRVLNAIYRSIEMGKEVNMNDPDISSHRLGL